MRIETSYPLPSGPWTEVAFPFLLGQAGDAGGVYFRCRPGALQELRRDLAATRLSVEMRDANGERWAVKGDGSVTTEPATSGIDGSAGLPAVKMHDRSGFGAPLDGLVYGWLRVWARLE